MIIKISLKTKLLLILSFLCIVGVVNNSFSQQEKDKDERCNDNIPLKTKPGFFRFNTGLNYRDSNDAKRFDRIYFDLFHNNFHGELGETKARWYSFGFNFSFMWDKPFSKKSPVGIGLGLGFSHWDIHHNGDFNFIDEGSNGKTDYTKLQKLPDSIYDSRCRNKVSFNYIEIPFELRFRNKGYVMFKFYPGFKVGVMTNIYTKEFSKNGDRIKDYSFPDEMRFSYGPTLRIGINQFFIYGYYNLAPMFRNNMSSKIHTFNIGISIGLLSEKRIN